MQDCLELLALTDPQVSLALSLMAVVIFCVLPSAPQALLVLLGCLASRGTQDTRETRERSGKTERRALKALLVPLASQALWVCRVLVV